MKFDLSQAWNDAVAILRGNMSLLLVVAGLFVFLPNLALYLLAPDLAAGPDVAGVEDPKVIGNIFGEYYRSAAPWVIGIAIVGMIGSLSMYALVATQRPTVGDALKTGVAALIPAFLAQILLGIGIGLLGALLIGIPFAIGVPALVALTGLIFIVVMLYVIVKFSLVSPAIVLDGIRNPIAALQRSWRLTKGNSFRLFGYYLILFVCVIVVASVFGLVSGLFVAMLGTGMVGSLLAGILNGFLSAVLAILGVGVLSAVHRQLAGSDPEAVSETFE